MEIIKTYQRAGYVLHPEVIAGIYSCGASLAVFSSYSIFKTSIIDRRNFFNNYSSASNHRQADKFYSILMDDNTIITKEALGIMLKQIKYFDLVSIPVNVYRPIQHECIIIQNKILDKYFRKYRGPDICSNCLWISELIDKHKIKYLALNKPVLRTIKRQMLRELKK